MKVHRFQAVGFKWGCQPAPPYTETGSGDGVVASAKESKEGDDEDDDDELCRYCFEGREEGELISPCKCDGGQKFVHLACLRRWQRMVLVSQPTHPAFYQDDVR